MEAKILDFYSLNPDGSVRYRSDRDPDEISTPDGPEQAPVQTAEKSQREGLSAGTDPDTDRGSTVEPGRDGSRSEVPFEDRYPFLDGVEKKSRFSIEAASSYFDGVVEGNADYAVSVFLEDIHPERRYTKFLVLAYVRQWMGWGASVEMMEAAFGVLANPQRRRYSNYLEAMNTIIGDFCKRTGNVIVTGGMDGKDP